MNQFIKRTISVIFNFKEMKDLYPHATGFKVLKWKLGRGIRNMSILALFVATGYVSARVWNYLNPIVVKADTVTVTVEVPKPLAIEDFPILMKICKAESGYKQFTSNGNVLRGKVTPSDIGICQINEPIWNDTARKRGYDIYTEKGNEDMAIWLFTHYGTEPWNASKFIWNK